MIGLRSNPTLERLYQEAKEEGELDLFFDALSSGQLIVVGISPEEIEEFIMEKRSWVH